MNKFNIGDTVLYMGDRYEVVGLSTMLNNQDGEPEWKITHEVQEVAIADIHEGISYQKPAWLPVYLITQLNPNKDTPNE